MGGSNHSGTDWSAVQYGDYIISTNNRTWNPSGGSIHVGIWHRPSGTYRKFRQNGLDSDRDVCVVVHDGDPMVIQSGPGSAITIRIDPAAGTVLEQFTSGASFAELRGRPPLYEVGGRLWGVQQGAVWTGWKYGTTNQTINTGIICYGWFVDGSDVYIWAPSGGGGIVKRVNLSSGTVVTIDSGMFPPGLQPSTNWGHFVIISGTYYWTRNDGVIAWTPGAPAYRIPAVGFPAALDLRVGPGVSAWQVDGPNVQTFNLLAATWTQESMTAVLPAGRARSSLYHIIEVDGEFWIPTVGVTP